MNISPTAVGMMKIRRWFSRTLEAGGMRRSNQRSRKRGSNLTPDARSRGRTAASQRRHLAQQPVHQRTAPVTGGIRALAQTVRLNVTATVATADARGALGGAACGAGSQEHSGLMPSYCAYVSDKICFRVFSST